MKYTTKYLLPEQEKMILDRINDSRIEAAVLLALYCGARRGEIMKVRQSDIDIIPRAVNIAGRTVYITHEQSERLMRAVQALHNGFSFDIDTPIYSGYNARYLSAMVRHWCACYGPEGMGLREMRHTAVVLSIGKSNAD